MTAPSRRTGGSPAPAAPGAPTTPAAPVAPEHEALRGLLGAWALRACRPDEAAELERHLADCPDCAEEGERLRRAAARLTKADPLDQPDGLRQQVLEFCLARRAPEHPLPVWAAPYAAETARLDALLRDLGPQEWRELAELPWHGGTLRLDPAEVLCHLAAVDSLLAAPLGLPDPLAEQDRVPPQGGGAPVPEQPRTADELPPPAPGRGYPHARVLQRTEQLILDQAGADPQQVRRRWRGQSQALLRAVGPAAAGRSVDYGFASVPLHDAFVDRAFETWIHAEDVARAVDYPYAVPSSGHLRQMVDLAVRMLPLVLAGQRQGAAAGAATGAAEVRVLRLVIEGPAAGEWLVPLDGTAPPGPPAEWTVPPVAELVMDGVEFCQLAAAHRDPEQLPVGQYGDRASIRALLAAVPLLSRP
ncbi:MDMPI N domain containing protein [Streptomyces tateyamensis]|uniref:MDMPI N domain containing protein n=1 Tax=Streptomyces tateyamensis TaxID=565073 RepID=A0A2V4PII2_9ACTN|nr:anti-sigma factor [Streptomyces tateyamensis]PYC85359.1 MDMPI N domain containing protein [Streptomyces tateyamensis]